MSNEETSEADHDPLQSLPKAPPSELRARLGRFGRVLPSHVSGGRCTGTGSDDVQRHGRRPRDQSAFSTLINRRVFV